MKILADGGWQVEFRVTVGKDNGFVGIDDVIVSPEACPDPVSCDFEDGSCLWQNFGGNSWITGEFGYVNGLGDWEGLGSK